MPKGCRVLWTCVGYKQLELSGHCKEAGLVAPCALEMFSARGMSKAFAISQKPCAAGVGENSGRGSIDAHIKVHLCLEGSSGCIFCSSRIARKLAQGAKQLPQQPVVRLCLKLQSLQVPGHLANGLCKHTMLTSPTFKVVLNSATFNVYCKWMRMPSLTVSLPVLGLASSTSNDWKGGSWCRWESQLSLQTFCERLKLTPPVHCPRLSTMSGAPDIASHHVAPAPALLCSLRT